MKKCMWVLGLALVVALASVANAAEKPAVPRAGARIYGINWQSVGWKTTVSINGLPVVQAGAGGGWCPVVDLVVKGENTIEVSAEQTDSDADPLSVVVAWGPASDQSKISGSVAKVEEPPSKVGTKVKETRQFKADMPIKWFWQKAKPIGTLTPADKAAVLKQVHGIYDAFVAKDVDQYQKSGMELYQDMATYLGISLQQVMAPEKQGLSRMFQADGYKAKMLKDADLKVEALGPFVLVSPAKPSRDAVIQISTSGLMGYKVRHLVFCEVDGKWWRAS